MRLWERLQVLFVVTCTRSHWKQQSKCIPNVWQHLPHLCCLGRVVGINSIDQCLAIKQVVYPDPPNGYLTEHGKCSLPRSVWGSYPMGSLPYGSKEAIWGELMYLKHFKARIALKYIAFQTIWLSTIWFKSISYRVHCVKPTLL